MSTSIILSGEPRSTNNVYKHTCRGKFAGVYLSKEGKALKESYQWEAKKQYRKKPMSGELEIWVSIYFGTLKRCDWDNFHKLSMDALTGIVWNDDSQIYDAHVSKRYDKKNPRIEIEIINVTRE